MLRFKQEDTSGGEAASTETTTETTVTPPQFAVSQEDWQATQAAIKQLSGLAPTVQQMQQTFEQLVQPEESDEDVDIDEYINRVVESRMGAIMPVVNSAAQRSGEEKMKEIFAAQEKDLGKFDHKLAERAAHSFFQETGDPQGSVTAGAKYAAEVRKAEREEGVTEYKASLKRGPHQLDPDVVGGADRQIPAAKTYDEVIERYAVTDEV